MAPSAQSEVPRGFSGRKGTSKWLPFWDNVGYFSRFCWFFFEVHFFKAFWLTFGAQGLPKWSISETADMPEVL